MRSLLFIDPGDLNFNVDQAGKHTARFQVLVMAVGDNGRVLDAWRREVPLALTDQTFQQIQAHGIVVTVRSAAKEPGPYQMRAAVEDLSSKRVGSAAQFLEVPEVGSGRLALSGVLLKGVAEIRITQAGVTPTSEAPAGLIDGVLLEPEVRVLSPGDNAVYAFEIYDGLKGDTPDLQMATAVIRDGKAVYQSPFAPVAASPKLGRQDTGDSRRLRRWPSRRTCPPDPTRSKSPSADEHQESSTEAVARLRGPAAVKLHVFTVWCATCAILDHASGRITSQG